MTALALFVVLAFYCATIGWRGVLLILDGRLAPVLLGVGVVLVPVVVVAAAWRLVAFARDGQAMLAEQSMDPAPQLQGWRALLAEAEAHRLAGEKAAEQAAYRRAVRAWRAAQ
ncbi:MAG TPA: hypothetical protein VFJ97_04715 [Dermatophilaceae bacterium]|nr:hypothetical protein [Dermatophilaceae bacterium]